MTIQLKTNSSASAAAFHLARNTQNLQKSLNRLASGSRIVQPADDTGGLAVSMKLQSSISRLEGAKHNAQNGVSFLEVQDGILSSAGRIVDRMIELKGMSQDMMKNQFDNATYENEFKDLQIQLYDMTQQTFNGVSLFATTVSDAGGGNAVYDDITADNTVSVFVSPDGSTGAKVSINKAVLLAALTIDHREAQINTGKAFQDADSVNIFSFAAENIGDAIELGDISVGVFNKALENIAGLRAQNGGTMSRLNFAIENISLQKANMEAALGRIVDVDVAAESSRLARNNVLVQASAAMLAQANTTPEIALMLLR